jgi:hypothetical protein
MYCGKCRQIVAFKYSTKMSMYDVSAVMQYAIEQALRNLTFFKHVSKVMLFVIVYNLRGL